MQQLDLFETYDFDLPELGPEADPAPWSHPMAFTLPEGLKARDYQNEFSDSVVGEWETVKSTMGVMATGTGKTFASMLVLRRQMYNTHADVLFLAQTKELVRQAAKSGRRMCPEFSLSVEMAEEYASTDSRMVIASKDSLYQDRLLRFPRSKFGAIVVDECHLLTKKNRSYQDILDHFSEAKILGLTATPDRADEYPMGENFDSVAFKMDIREAVDSGWLVPVWQQQYFVEQFSVDSILGSAGQVDAVKLAEEMRTKKMLYAVCEAAIDGATSKDGPGPLGRQTLVFAASVEHAREIAGMINARNAKDNSVGEAASVDSYMADGLREAVIERFLQKKTRYLVNFGVLTTGFDDPNIQVVVMARLTNSRSLYAQMAGRGLRPLEEIVKELAMASNAQERKKIILSSKKPGVLLIDLVGVSAKHKLVTSVDLLGGDYEDDQVAAAKPSARPKPLEKTFDEAAIEAKQKDLERRKQIIASVKFTKKSVSPYDLWDVPVMREPGWSKGKPMTQGQRDALERAGVKKMVLDKLSFHKASTLLDTIKKRREAEKCTYKQALILVQFGYSPDLSFSEANTIITRLQENNWRHT